MFSCGDSDAYVQGRVCGPDRQIGSLGDHEVQVVLPKNYAHLLVTLPIEALSGYLSPSECCLFLETLATIEKGLVDPVLKRETCARLLRTFERIEARGDTLTPTMKKEFCRSIVHELFSYLAAHSGVDLLRTSNDEKILGRALNLIASQPEHFFTLEDLAREVFASKRAVQYAFSRILGLSPMRFQKLYRLNLVRNEIRVTRSPLKLSGLLPKHFFSNAGRMSREYEELFGERPRETLRQVLADMPAEAGIS
ncbi:MAG: AraC family transcriptional regulator, ethanolamine operon transcriptional activator [Pseudomonadota bacterium]